MTDCWAAKGSMDGKYIEQIFRNPHIFSLDKVPNISADA